MSFESMRLDELALGGEAGLVDGPFGSNLPATDYVAYGVPVIRGSNLSKGQVRFRGKEFVFVSEATAEKHVRSTCQPNDIVFTKKGTLGQVGIVPSNKFPRYLLSSNQMRLRVDPRIANPNYVYYALSSAEAIDQVIRESEHTGVPKINLAYIRQFRIRVPCMAVQDTVATLLRALDDRIELLREKNTILEALTQSFFKSWFIDFDPVRAKAEGREPEGMNAEVAELFPSSFEKSELGESPAGWCTGTLGDLAQTARSQRQPSDFDASIHYVGLEHIPRGSLSLTKWGNAAGLESAKSSFQKGDILFGKLRPYFHKVVVAPFNGVCSTDVLVCQPKIPAFHGVVMMYLSSKPLIDYAERLSNGAKMPRVSWKDLAAYPVVLPPEPLAECYRVATEPLVQSIVANVHKAKTLADLRDTLLPRLISGQLRLPEAEALLRDAA
jgi:type I restriction enzyme S subunit